MAQTVIGFFDNSSEAQQAIERLTSYGISRDRIDISSGNTYNSGSISQNTSDRDRDDNDDNSITRFFKNLFGNDNDDADKYSKVASRAQSIVTVHANSNDEAEEAADILDECGAIDVDERASQYGLTGSSNIKDSIYGNDDDMNMGSDRSDFRKTEDRMSSGPMGSNDYTEDQSRKMNVIKEDINVGKREVEKGGVRLRSRIVERPVEETVRLREERVNVQRTPVDRAASESDFSNFEEQDIEMIEHAEVPVVNKDARVVEEVSLNKDVEEREETIRDTVRNTEVDVENINESKRKRPMDR